MPLVSKVGMPIPPHLFQLHPTTHASHDPPPTRLRNGARKCPSTPTKPSSRRQRMPPAHLPSPRRFLFNPRPPAADESSHGTTTGTRLWNGATLRPLQKIQRDIAHLRQRMKALQRKAYKAPLTRPRLRLRDDGVRWESGGGLRDQGAEMQVRDLRRIIRLWRCEEGRERMKLTFGEGRGGKVEGKGKGRWVDGERGWVGVRCEVEKVDCWEDPFL